MYFIDNQKLIKRSVELARLAAGNNEVPVGALIVDEFGNIIVENYNQVIKHNNPLAHAEILVIQGACSKLNTRYLNNCTMYVSLQPCAMCVGAIKESSLQMVYYAALNSKSANITEVNIHYYDSKESLESEKILKNFFLTLR